MRTVTSRRILAAPGMTSTVLSVGRSEGPQPWVPSWADPSVPWPEPCPLSGVSSTHSCSGTHGWAAFMGGKGLADPPSLLRGRNLHPQVTLSRSPAPQAAHLAAPGMSHASQGSGLCSGCDPRPRLRPPRHTAGSAPFCAPSALVSPLPQTTWGALGCFCVGALVTDAAWTRASAVSWSQLPALWGVDPEVQLLGHTMIFNF